MIDCPTPNKVSYDEPQAAQRHATALARTKGAPFVHAYHCPCGKWHVGRSTRLISRMLGPRRRLPGSKGRKW